MFTSTTATIISSLFVLVIIFKLSIVVIEKIIDIFKKVR
jgi:hypothetical protein